MTRLWRTRPARFLGLAAGGSLLALALSACMIFPVTVSSVTGTYEPYNPSLANQGLPAEQVDFTVGGSPSGSLVCLIEVFSDAGQLLGSTVVTTGPQTGLAPTVDESVAVPITGEIFDGGPSNARVVCGGKSATTTVVGPTGTPPSACPASPPAQPSTPVQNQQSLVPTGATSVLLCEYNVLNPPLRLVAEQTVTNAAVVDRLTSESNSGSVPPPGTAQSCPADIGQDVDAYFVYQGKALWLWVDMTGCNPIIDRYGWSEDGGLVLDLRGLLGS
jgi:hypothetical protein